MDCKIQDARSSYLGKGAFSRKRVVLVCNIETLNLRIKDK